MQRSSSCVPHSTHELAHCDGATARAQTDTENLLTSFLQEPCLSSIIDLNRHLVELGGDSLVAMRLMARLSEAFEIDLSPVLPFEVASLRDLVARIDMMRQSIQD